MIKVWHSFTKKVDDTGNLRVFVNISTKGMKKLSGNLYVKFTGKYEDLFDCKKDLNFEAQRGMKTMGGYFYLDVEESLAKRITEISWSIGKYSGKSSSEAPFEDLTKINLKTPFLKTFFKQIFSR